MKRFHWVALLALGCGGDSPEPHERFNTTPCDGGCRASATGPAGASGAADATPGPTNGPDAAVDAAVEAGCTPGAAQACMCPNLASEGVSVCKLDGSFGACMPCIG